jgi:hypothetical protein
MLHLADLVQQGIDAVVELIQPRLNIRHIVRTTIGATWSELRTWRTKISVGEARARTVELVTLEVPVCKASAVKLSVGSEPEASFTLSKFATITIIARELRTTMKILTAITAPSELWVAVVMPVVVSPSELWGTVSAILPIIILPVMIMPGELRRATAVRIPTTAVEIMTGPRRSAMSIIVMGPSWTAGTMIMVCPVWTVAIIVSRPGRPMTRTIACPGWAMPVMAVGKLLLGFMTPNAMGEVSGMSVSPIGRAVAHHRLKLLPGGPI